MYEIIDKIKKSITDTEFEGKTFIVGGFVRDMVMGIETNDLDITVEIPQGGIKLARFLHQAGLSSKPVVFRRFGTAMAQIDDYRIEFVMTRNESYRSKNRKPLTRSASITEDILRRDFTINSLIMDIMTGDIKDLSGKGISDIENKIIRSTSRPEFIFCEDPLRILRAIRFANRFQYEIEDETKKGIIQNRKELIFISWERKRDEFTKILLSDTPQNGLNLLFDFKLMQFVIPEIIPYRYLLHYKTLEALPSQILPRLAIIFVGIMAENNGEELIKKILLRLRYAGKIYIRSLLFLNLINIAENWLESNTSDDLELRKYYYKNSETFKEYFKWLEYHFLAYNRKNQFNRIEIHFDNIVSELKQKTYPLDGFVLQKCLNLEKGPRIGECLEYGLGIWLKNPKLTAEELLAALTQNQNLTGSSDHKEESINR